PMCTRPRLTLCERALVLRKTLRWHSSTRRRTHPTQPFADHALALSRPLGYLTPVDGCHRGWLEPFHRMTRDGWVAAPRRCWTRGSRAILPRRYSRQLLAVIPRNSSRLAHDSAGP